MGRVLYVIFTNGNVLEKGVLKPTLIAQARFRAGIAHLRKHHHSGDADMMFLGGARNDYDASEAVVLARWAAFQPEMKGLLCLGGFSLAKGKYTAADVVALVAGLKDEDYDLLYFVTHPDHAHFASQTVFALDQKLTVLPVSSNEPAPYSWWELKILKWVYRHDPTWVKWHSWPLRVMANRRGQNE